MKKKIDESLIREKFNLLKGVYWHHSIKLLPDLLVEGGKSFADLENEKKILIDPINFNEKSVLEIGSWTGFHAFEAKKAGAKKVVATDKFCWNSDEFRGRETFELAKYALGLDIDAVEIDPNELPGGKNNIPLLENADIVLLLGVIYHMYNPILILNKINELTKDLLIIETHQDLQWLNRPAMAFYPRDTLQGDPTNWWGPNPECLVELLETNNFNFILYQEGMAGGTRGYYHAFRNEDVAKKYLKKTNIDNKEIFNLSSQEGKNKIFGKKPSVSNSEIFLKLKKKKGFDKFLKGWKKK